MSFRATRFALVALLAVACGGQSQSHGSGGTGGSGNAGTGGDPGGTSTGGTSTGGTSTGGDAGTSTGGTKPMGGTTATGGSAGQVCCGAFPTCGPDEQETDKASCDSSPTCRTVTLCCSVIFCVKEAQCHSVPTCDEGDTQLPATCPPDLTDCYERTQCGTTITCRDDFCDPPAEYNRSYVGQSPDACAVIDFECTGATKYFFNACGCGCEQDPSCPPFVDCEPGPEPNPNCTDEILARCPLSPRGL